MVFLCQVVDGFFVKRVQDVRESAAYLTVMTRYLTKLYQVTHAQNSLVQKFQSSLRVTCGVKENICKSLNCEGCFTLLILFWSFYFPELHADVSLQRAGGRRREWWGGARESVLLSHLFRGVQPRSRQKQGECANHHQHAWNTAKPQSESNVFADVWTRLPLLLSSVRQSEKCLPDSWCRSAVCLETKQLQYWSTTTLHTGM